VRLNECPRRRVVGPATFRPFGCVRVCQSS
jgi:hypothetical protein